MSFFVREREVEQRAIDPASFITGADTGPGYSPRQVTTERALKLAPVYAASRTIADDVASLPLDAFTGSGPARRPTKLPRLFQTLADRGELFDWIFQPVVSIGLRGNAYGLIVALGPDGYPSQIEWLDPDDVDVTMSGGRVVYKVFGKEVDASSLVHIRGYRLPGKATGLSPIAAYAATIETGLMAADFGRDWFANGNVPSGVVESDKRIDTEVNEAVKARFKAAARKRQVVSLGSGLTYKQIAVSPNESQFIETHKLTATFIANLFGIRPERIGGEVAGSMTYRNVEQNSIVDADALRPWVARLEGAFYPLTTRPTVVKFDLDANVRADIKTRYEAHGIGVDKGFLLRSEVRVAEDLPPVDGIDDQPQPAPSPVAPPAAPSPGVPA